MPTFLRNARSYLRTPTAVRALSAAVGLIALVVLRNAMLRGATYVSRFVLGSTDLAAPASKLSTRMQTMHCQPEFHASCSAQPCDKCRDIGLDARARENSLSQIPANAHGSLRNAIQANIEELALIGRMRNPTTVPDGVNRPYLSEESRLARQLLIRLMQKASMTTSTDFAGNVIGKLECKESNAPRKVVMVGSHHDTVVNGGKWDGALGVIAAIAVVDEISSRANGACALPFDLHVISFDDEEGNNPFGTTNLGAKAFAGQLLDFDRDFVPPGWRRDKLLSAFGTHFGLTGANEVWLALQSAATSVSRNDIIGFLELHIEQGPVLVKRDVPVGIVSAIAGQTRMTLQFEGSAGHAGTVPMEMRKDALVAAARVVSFVDDVARKYAKQGVVATVGTLQVQPGGTNIVPGHVSMSLDIRAPEDNDRISALNEILSHCRQICTKQEIKFSSEVNHEVAAVVMSPWLREIMSVAVLTSMDMSGKNQILLPDGSSIGSTESSDGNITNVDDCDMQVLPVPDVDRELPVAGKCPSTPNENAARRSSADVVVLPSGAGHDTQFMARIAPTAMLFVRCRDGISHSPYEHVALEDAEVGAKTLLATIEQLAKSFRS